MPDWDSAEGAVIYSCGSSSLHLAGKSFLDNGTDPRGSKVKSREHWWGQQLCPSLLCAQAPPLQA